MVAVVLVYEEVAPLPSATFFDGGGVTGRKCGFPVFRLDKEFRLLRVVEWANVVFTASRLSTRSDAIQIFVGRVASATAARKRVARMRITPDRLRSIVSLVVRTDWPRVRALGRGCGRLWRWVRELATASRHRHSGRVAPRAEPLVFVVMESLVRVR